MILSDRSISEALDSGRIVVDPIDPSMIQPSSVDVTIDRFFRVFRNHTMGIIDVKQNLEDLTELVEIAEDDVFILHPGEFVLGSTARTRGATRRPGGTTRGEVEPRPAGPAHPLHRGVRRRRLGRPPDARALQRRHPARSRSTRA